MVVGINLFIVRIISNISSNSNKIAILRNNMSNRLLLPILLRIKITTPIPIPIPIVIRIIIVNTTNQVQRNKPCILHITKHKRINNNPLYRIRQITTVNIRFLLQHFLA